MNSVSPDRRLLAAVALWVALAVVAVALPVLWPLAAAAALLLVAVVGWDALLLRRTPRIEVERRLPARAFEGRSADLELRLRNPGRMPVQARDSDNRRQDDDVTDAAAPRRRHRLDD